MKKGFGLAEFLIVVVIIVTVFLWCSGNKYGRPDPFADRQEVKNRQEIVNDKIQDIENTKALKQRIENNLKEGY